ncbi:MAG TPA: nitroreductase family protein [Candidatus Binataceae bacterium]|nr:nitroreductase family protein [Candidatus Binataceae bacterium]
MEYKEVVGRRRTIRYFQSWRQVEREKIQIMLEAARLASCAVNATFLKAIVVIRDDIPRETLDAIKTPVSGLNIELAPVHIYTFADMGAYKGAQARLKKLVDVGALNATHGWSHKFVDEFVWPNVLKPLAENANTPSVAAAAASDAGIAICQAMLAAVDEGLGVCLSAFQHEHMNKILKAPPEWLPLWVLLVGYPAESWEAGGQRPRPPIEEIFFEGSYGKPFKADPKVTEKMKEAKMIQAQAPLPWRKEEIKALARMFGLPE